MILHSYLERYKKRYYESNVRQCLGSQLLLYSIISCKTRHSLLKSEVAISKGDITPWRLYLSRRTSWINPGRRNLGDY
jgi:hypothetical protein